MIGIYKIHNNLNGKEYIGQSNDIYRRWKEHCSPSRYLTSRIPVDAAIHKYGKENFTLTVVEECPLEKLNKRETYWIHYYDTVNKGYNCTYGTDQEVQGEKNPNAHLNEKDVYFIREVYNDHLMSSKECWQLFKDRITWNSFMSVWQGISWSHIRPEVFTEENKNYYLRLAARKVNDSFSEEEILYWRNLYVTASAPDLFIQYSKEHSDIDYKTFQRMLCGINYTYLPYYHKKTKKWIQPGEKPESSPSRRNFYNKKNNPFTDEEVAHWRQLYAQGQDYKDLYEMSDKRVALSSFQNMLCGKSYKNLPYYSKKQQKWVNK